jgi:hypothetical protein
MACATPPSKLITKRQLYRHETAERGGEVFKTAPHRLAVRPAAALDVVRDSCGGVDLWPVRNLTFDAWIGPAAEGGGLGSGPIN